MHGKAQFFRRGTATRMAVSAAVVCAGLVTLAVPAAAAPSISAPSSGVAGRNIIISGSGWPSFENVNAFLNQGTAQNFFCSLTSNASGNLGPGACTVPSSLPQGAYTLSVTDNTNTVNQSFTLKPGAHASVSASGGPIGSAADGQTVYLAGVGFAAGSTIASVTVGATAVTTTPASPVVSSQGSFSGVNFTVPATQPAGTTAITVTDAASNTATFTLVIYAATDGAASSGVSGRNLSISGTGWPNSDPSVNAYLQQGATQTYFCTLAADASGDLGPQSCSLPTSLPQGAYILSVTDQAVTVNTPFTLNPGAHASETSTSGSIGSAARGQTVYLAGSGFTAGSTITSVKIGSTAVVTTPASPAVSTQGSFSGVTFTVPKSGGAGVATVTVTDAASHSAQFKLNIFVATDSSPASGVSGRNLAVSGTGWPANDSVNFYLNQGTVQNYFCTVGTDDSGNLGPQHCPLPTNLPRGAYTLSATDQSVTVNKAFTLNPGAHVAATASGSAIGSVAAGQTVYLSGSGFTSNLNIKTLTVAGTAVTMTPTAPVLTPQGSFSGVTFTVPAAQPAGPASVVVTDSQNRAATFVLTVFAATASSAASGVGGRPLAISGGGWPANDSVNAYLVQGTSQNYFCTVTTDTSGNLGPGACTLPSNLPQGSYTLLLTDGSVVVNRAFTLNPALSLTNTSNQPIVTAARGSTVDFSGASFSASTTITSVKIGATTVATSPPSPLVNAQGSFSGASFVVPTGLAVGSYTVTVTDSSGKSGTAPLSVT